MSQTNQEKRFEVFSVDVDGKSVELKMNEPNLGQQQEALKVRNRTFYDSVESGAYLRVQIKDIMEKRDIWNEEKEMKYNTLQRQVTDADKRLQEGGFKLTEAKQLAMEMKSWRDKMRELLMERSEFDNNTAEGQADNASFNYLISACLVYNDTGKPFFSGLDDYLNRSTNPIAIKAARCLAAMTYGLKSDIEKELPENEFLYDYGFIDDELRLINEQGKLIDEDGRLINEEGFLVNEEGRLIDKDGDVLTDDGKLDVEKKPFLDEEGNDVEVKEIEIKEIEETETTKESEEGQSEENNSDD